VFDRPLQQPAVRGDLHEWRPWRIQAEAVAARVGGVEQPQAIAGGGDLQHRPGRTVDEDDVAQYPFHVGVGDAGTMMMRRIAERAVLVERPVGDHQWDVAITGGQPERVLLVVGDNVEPGQAPVHLRAGEIHPVVVVPQRRPPLPHRVGVVAPAGGRDEIGGVAVAVRGGVSAVQMHCDRYRQVVAVGDHRRAPGAGDECRAREPPVIAEDPGTQSRQDLHVRLALSELVEVGGRVAACRPRDRWDRQRDRVRAGQPGRAAQNSPVWPRGRPRASPPKLAVPSAESPSAPRTWRRFTGHAPAGNGERGAPEGSRRPRGTATRLSGPARRRVKRPAAGA
jgi:hypothetical protein